MRLVDSATSTYLQARAGIDTREAVYITAKDRDTGAPESIGLWNGHDTVTFTVTSGETGAPVTRNYTGAGSLLGIGVISLTNDLTIQTVQVSLSNISAEVAAAVRLYDSRLAKIDIHRPLFNLATNALVGDSPAHFHGRVNTLDIEDPEPGQEGSITLICTGHLRELTRTNAAKRSDATQFLRSGDHFRRFSGVAFQTPIKWGEK